MRFPLLVSIIYALESQAFSPSSSLRQHKVFHCWVRTDAIVFFENCDNLEVRKQNLCKVGSRRMAGITRITSVSEIQKQSRMRRILTGACDLFFKFYISVLNRDVTRKGRRPARNTACQTAEAGRREESEGFRLFERTEGGPRRFLGRRADLGHSQNLQVRWRGGGPRATRRPR
jgi:hypothetical protein